MLSDTAPDVERIMADIYRHMPMERKFAIMDDAIRTTRVLHDSGYRLRNPGATGQQIWADWLYLIHGDTVAPHILEAVPMSQIPTESIRTTREVMDALRRIGVASALGGSLASSAHGYPRSTQDADVLTEPFPGREQEFVTLLGPVYYANVDTIRTAVRERSSFNVIHTTTGFKVDLFIQKRRPFDRSILDRRTTHNFATGPEGVLEIVTAEDSILLKLEWYRMGGESSERQWSDILGVLRTQRERLDRAYLERWAREIGVHDLLVRVQKDV